MGEFPQFEAFWKWLETIPPEYSVLTVILVFLILRAEVILKAFGDLYSQYRKDSVYIERERAKILKRTNTPSVSNKKKRRKEQLGANDVPQIAGQKPEEKR